MDIDMPNVEGWRDEIDSQDFPAIRVLILSIHSNKEYRAGKSSGPARRAMCEGTRRWRTWCGH